MQYATDITKLWQELAAHVSERDLLIGELELLSGSLVASTISLLEKVVITDEIMEHAEEILEGLRKKAYNETDVDVAKKGTEDDDYASVLFLGKVLQFDIDFELENDTKVMKDKLSQEHVPYHGGRSGGGQRKTNEEEKGVW
ncbi:hypothetical protein Tco_0026845 [Tanacetum coccineum]